MNVSIGGLCFKTGALLGILYRWAEDRDVRLEDAKWKKKMSQYPLKKRKEKEEMMYLNADVKG